MATVYFSSTRCHSTVSPLTKIKKLFNRCGAKDIYSPGDLVAVKLHFGELGNTAFIRPIYLRPVLETLKEYKTKPFLTDTNTLYVGMRSNSVDHLHNASLNGFNYSALQTPVIIADGLRGEEFAEVPVPGGKLFESAKLAKGIINADAMVMFSHFKGHQLTGFGGAIKNLAMGCAARSGKMAMHSGSKPYVKESLCTACGRCLSACQVNAITISKTAFITDKCTGCCRCIGMCPGSAIKPKYDNSNELLMKNIVEYASAAASCFKKPVIYINILTSISPACDCLPGNDAPVTADIGFMSSTDPVALDKASYDMVKERCQGGNPFAVDGGLQIDYAEQIRFGSSCYEIKTVN